MGINDRKIKTKDLENLTQEEFDTYVPESGPALPEEREKLLNGVGPAVDKPTGPAKKD